MHGGASPGGAKGNQNARKHGIYSAGLLDEEHDLWDDIGVGTLDDDIRIAKLQLRRALIAQKNQPADGLELYEETMNGGGGDGAEEKPAASMKRRRTQYDDIISRLLGRIGDLEQKRAEIMERTGGDKANAAETARKVREALEAMRQATGA
jgi:cellulose synthase/poly-beta-1,6-N-acetylglucosamine synthase-like glycosyltransferase